MEYRNMGQKLLINALLCAALNGCVSPNALVQSEQRPSEANGYIAGMFSGKGPPHGTGISYGFVFSAEGSSNDYILPFFVARVESYHEEKIRLIEVPPGTYKLTSWITYDSGTGERITKVNTSSRWQQVRIKVQPSKVVFVGRYKTSERDLVTQYQYGVVPLPISESELRHSFAEQFPNFPAESLQ